MNSQRASAVRGGADVIPLNNGLARVCRRVFKPEDAAGNEVARPVGDSEVDRGRPANRIAGPLDEKGSEVAAQGGGAVLVGADVIPLDEVLVGRRARIGLQSRCVPRRLSHRWCFPSPELI